MVQWDLTQFTESKKAQPYELGFLRVLSGSPTATTRRTRGMLVAAKHEAQGEGH
jgi:hypothetical protein